MRRWHLGIAAIVALMLALMVASLAGCSREVEGPPIDRNRVAQNRAIIAECSQNGWNGCGGGFVRTTGDPLLRRILNVDGATTATMETPRFDEISTDQIIEQATPGEAGDRYLSTVTFILPSDETLFEAAAVEYARQRVDPRDAPSPTAP